MATSKTKFIAYQKSIKIWKKYNKVHLDHKLTKIWEEAFRAGWNANKKHYNDKMKIYNSIDNVKIYNSIENIIKRNIMKNKSRKVNKLKKLGIKIKKDFYIDRTSYDLVYDDEGDVKYK